MAVSHFCCQLPIHSALKSVNIMLRKLCGSLVTPRKIATMVFYRQMTDHSSIQNCTREMTFRDSQFNSLLENAFVLTNCAMCIQKGGKDECSSLEMIEGSLTVWQRTDKNCRNIA